MDGPRGGLLETALDGERAFRGLVGHLQHHAGGRLRKDERLADFKVLDDKRTPLEQLHTRFQCHFDKAGTRENNVRINLVILEEGHVP